MVEFKSPVTYLDENDQVIFMMSEMKLKKAQIQPNSPAIRDPEWQAFRLSLKGLSTTEKLRKLRGWLARHSSSEKARIQVQNYINALKRGGQLSTSGKVQR